MSKVLAVTIVSLSLAEAQFAPFITFGTLAPRLTTIPNRLTLPTLFPVPIRTTEPPRTRPTPSTTEPPRTRPTPSTSILRTTPASPSIRTISTSPRSTPSSSSTSPSSSSPRTTSASTTTESRLNTVSDESSAASTSNNSTAALTIAVPIVALVVIALAVLVYKRSQHKAPHGGVESGRPINGYEERAAAVPTMPAEYADLSGPHVKHNVTPPAQPPTDVGYLDLYDEVQYVADSTSAGFRAQSVRRDNPAFSYEYDTVDTPSNHIYENEDVAAPIDLSSTTAPGEYVEPEQTSKSTEPPVYEVPAPRGHGVDLYPPMSPAALTPLGEKQTSTSRHAPRGPRLSFKEF